MKTILEIPASGVKNAEAGRIDSGKGTTPVQSGIQDMDDVDGATFTRYQHGDPHAMRLVVERYHRRLIAFVALFTPNVEMAEEVAQETFLAAWKQRTDIHSPGKLRPWLFTVAKRKALKELEKKRYSTERTVEDEVLEASAGTVDAVQAKGLMEADRNHTLQKVILGLGETDRELIQLRYFAGLQIKEISETLSMPMGTVGVKLGRAVDRIRRKLEELGLSSGDFGT